MSTLAAVAAADGQQHVTATAVAAVSAADTAPAVAAAGLLNACPSAGTCQHALQKVDTADAVLMMAATPLARSVGHLYPAVAAS